MLAVPFGSAEVSSPGASQSPRLGSGLCAGGNTSELEVSRQMFSGVALKKMPASQTLTGLGFSALTLLVTRVFADDHDAAVATNHLALVTDLLHARVDLHREALSSVRTERGLFSWILTCSDRRSDRG